MVEQRRMNTVLRATVLLITALVLSSCASWTRDYSLPPPQKALDIAQTARKQIGVPYRPGGTNRKGFDCSGLVLFCYAAHGISLPRTADDQSDVGESVPERYVHEGDILVFTPGFWRKHTGIYVGDGKFVHAPGKGRKVTLCTLNAPHWQDMLSDIRRVLVENPLPQEDKP